ncbi:hypothetical protein V8C42DRAFT_133900 [Trichoderma barbatum]
MKDLQWAKVVFFILRIFLLISFLSEIDSQQISQPSLLPRNKQLIPSNGLLYSLVSQRLDLRLTNQPRPPLLRRNKRLVFRVSLNSLASQNLRLLSPLQPSLLQRKKQLVPSKSYQNHQKAFRRRLMATQAPTYQRQIPSKRLRSKNLEKPFLKDNPNQQPSLTVGATADHIQRSYLSANIIPQYCFEQVFAFFFFFCFTTTSES